MGARTQIPHRPCRLLSLPNYSMRVHARHLPIATVGLLLGCSGNATPPTLSNEAAKVLLEKEWNAGFPAQLGRVEFVSGPSAVSQNKVSAAVIPVYRVLVARGYLSLASDKNSPLDLSSIAEQTLNGSSATATVSATAAGRAAAAGTGRDSGAVLHFPVGEYRIEKIVSNDTIATSPEPLRLVQGLHTAVVDPALSAALAKLDGASARERRFRVLLRFDTQALRWTVVAIDLSDRTQDFTTRYVPDALRVVAEQAKSQDG